MADRRAEDDAPTAMRRSLAGTRLGDYQVELPLGEGGMGVVYRAEHVVLGKGVAIKVLKDELVDDEKHVARLLEEARIVARLKHPNIADVHGFGRTPDGHPYFVMELLEGTPLDRLIDDTGAQPLADCLDIIDQVLAALSAAHAAGLVHRDLKPSNVFLERLPDGARHVKLLDFGLAKRLDRSPSQPQGKRPSMMLVGTPDSMAPEQVHGDAIGPGTDLWAVGVLLYELCTGVRPFVAARSIEVLMQVLNNTPKAPSAHDRSLPPALDDLVFKLLDKSLDARPNNALAVRSMVSRLRREVHSARTSISSVSLSRARPQMAESLAEPTEQFRVTSTQTDDAETQLRTVMRPTMSGEVLAPPREPVGRPARRSGWLQPLALAALVSVLVGAAAGLVWLTRAWR